MVRAKGKFVRPGLLGAVVIAAPFLAVMFGPATVNALDCNGLSGRRLMMCQSARNDGERYAVRQICVTGSVRCGAMWMSTPGTAYTNDAVATVNWNATSISLELRGSVNGNGFPAASVAAVNVSVSQGNRLLVANATLNRGRHPGNSYQWVDAGHSIRVDSINIVNVAPSGGNGTITLKVHRCFYSHPGGVGTCADQDVSVTINREKPPERWTALGDSRVEVNGNNFGREATATPGQRIRFFHSIRNDSGFTIPAYTLKRFDISQTVDGVAQQHLLQSPYDFAVSPGTLFYTANQLKPYTVMVPDGVVSHEDVGKRVCQRIMWRPHHWQDPGWGESPSACVMVPHQYNLTPQINAPDYVTEGTSEVSGLSASIDHAGATRSRPVHYAVVRFVVRGASEYVVPGGEGVVVPNDPRNPANLVGRWDCYIATDVLRRSRAGLTVTDCTSKNLAKNDGNTVIRQGGLTIPLGKDVIAGVKLSPADQLCYMTLVSLYTQDIAAKTFRYRVDCVRMAARPKAQFWGADVRVGSSLIGGAGNNNAEVRTAITSVRK